MERRSIGIQIYGRLREDILGGTRPPGERINELTVAREFEVSQGPVREALAALRGEGLVVLSPSKGTFVADISIADAQMAYQLRLALEPMAVGRMIENGYEEGLEELQRVHDIMKRRRPSTAVATLVRDDLRFHGAMYRFAQSDLLLKMWHQLETTMRRYFSVHFNPHLSTAHWDQDLPGTHKLLLDTIMAGNVDKARAAVSDHIAQSWDGLALTFGRPNETLAYIIDEEK